MSFEEKKNSSRLIRLNKLNIQIRFMDNSIVEKEKKTMFETVFNEEVS